MGNAAEESASDIFICAFQGDADLSLRSGEERETDSFGMGKGGALTRGLVLRLVLGWASVALTSRSERVLPYNITCRLYFLKVLL